MELNCQSLLLVAIVIFARQSSVQCPAGLDLHTLSERFALALFQ